MFGSVIAINVGNFVFNENDPSANKNGSLRTGSLHIVRIRSSPPYRAIRGLSGDTTTCAILTPSTITVTSVGPDERKVYFTSSSVHDASTQTPLSPSIHGNVPHASLSARREESGSDRRGFTGAFPPARPGIQGCRRSGMADARTCRCRIRLLLPDRSRRRRRPGAGTCL